MIQSGMMPLLLPRALGSCEARFVMKRGLVAPVAEAAVLVVLVVLVVRGLPSVLMGRA